MLFYGKFPSDSIDHINGDRSDNRIANLREATIAENKQNIGNAPSHNKSGLIGAHRDASGRGWSSCIIVNKKYTYLGRFATAEEAHAAYVKAKTELHPFWARK